MLRFAESLLDPTARPPEEPPAPEALSGPAPAVGGRNGTGSGLFRFYWHFIRQERWLAVAMFVLGGLIAVLDASIPAFIGRVVHAGVRP